MKQLMCVCPRVISKLANGIAIPMGGGGGGGALCAWLQLANQNRLATPLDVTLLWLCVCVSVGTCVCMKCFQTVWVWGWRGGWPCVQRTDWAMCVCGGDGFGVPAVCGCGQA